MDTRTQVTTKPPARIEAVNDFVVKFANVNGSGSASANEMFARSILRMGVPVSPRNIFPSNIQGLPIECGETGLKLLPLCGIQALEFEKSY